MFFFRSRTRISSLHEKSERRDEKCSSWRYLLLLCKFLGSLIDYRASQLKVKHRNQGKEVFWAFTLNSFCQISSIFLRQFHLRQFRFERAQNFRLDATFLLNLTLPFTRFLSRQFLSTWWCRNIRFLPVVLWVSFWKLFLSGNKIAPRTFGKIRLFFGAGIFNVGLDRCLALIRIVRSRRAARNRQELAEICYALFAAAPALNRRFEE